MSHTNMPVAKQILISEQNKNAKCFSGPRKCQPWPSDQKNLPTKFFFRPNSSFRPKFFSDQKKFLTKKNCDNFFSTTKKNFGPKICQTNSFSNQPNWL